MNALAEWIIALMQRLTRRPPTIWVWRGVMLACGLGAQAWVVAVGPLVVLALVALCAIVIAVVVPRTVMPLIAAALVVIEAAMIEVTIVEAVPLAVALLGWHLAATALAAARPWARMDPSVWRALIMPSAAALGGVGIAIPLALAGTSVSLPPLGLVTVALVLVAAAGMMLVLWPSAQRRGARR